MAIGRRDPLSLSVPWLSWPLSTGWCIAGWVVSTSLYVLCVQLGGGAANGDSQQSVYAAWALAHGHLACGYPPSGTLGYGATAPVYILVSGALLALLRIGGGVAFPSGAQLGPHCANAVSAMNQWSFSTGSLPATLRIGYVGWAVLAVGIVVALRAMGRGRCGWEPAVLLVAACVPPVAMGLREYFHPEDMVAMGLVLIALAAVRKDQWALAGVWLGLAVATQQFAILVAIPLLVIAPSTRRLRYVASAAITVVVLAVPLGALTSWRALPTVFVGTGESSVAGSLLTLTGMHGSVLFAVSRIVPIAVAALVAGWAAERLGARVLQPVPLVALVAIALALRLVFDVAVWGYYLLGITVALLVLEAVRGTIRLALVAWLGLVSLAALGGALDYRTTLPMPTWCWQLAIDATALALAASALLGAVRAHRSGITDPRPVASTTP